MLISKKIPGLLLLLFATQAVADGPTLSTAERSAAFKAAGFRHKGSAWVSCGRGTLDEVRDINGDGLPEALISEQSLPCFGNAGIGFSLVGKQPDGHWRLLFQDRGMPIFLAGPGFAGWPDMQVVGPGFCFPVYRWDGRKYQFNRHEYEGKPCSP